MSEKYVVVRREPKGREGRVRLDDIRDLHWDIITGGRQALLPDFWLFGYVLCTEVQADDFGHSGIHGPCPHNIKICINKKDNPKFYNLLAEEAGEKPESLKRKPLSKAEKAGMLYLMWGIPNKDDEYPEYSALPEEYYKDYLIGRFILRCKKRKLNWAILSPSHGVWKPEVPNIGLEKYLRDAKDDEIAELIKQIDQIALNYKEIIIYSGRAYDRSDLHKNLIKRAHEKEKFYGVETFDDVR